MGWRKHTLTVVDSPAALNRAAVGRSGPLDVVQFAWEMASRSQREEIAAWVYEQTSRREGKGP
jgi:hypothetical protein